MENSAPRAHTALPDGNDGIDTAPQKPVDLSAAAFVQPKIHKRTTGLRLFDVLLYPVIANFGVFAISVAATYLTSRGADKRPDGSLRFGWIGEAFQERGEWMKGHFKKWGMNESSADMSKMVFFSFADGTLLAPVIKLLEDRREKIAHWIDCKLGTVSKDPEVYAAEPKQSWMSVLAGRLATCLIVVPTAAALNNMHIGEKNLNDILFNDHGYKKGVEVAKDPKWAKWFKGLDIPELFKIGYFEAFYTTVCTAGLYVSSRSIARFMEKKKPADVTTPAQADAAQSASSCDTPLSSAHDKRDTRLFTERLQTAPHAHGLAGTLG